jgi:transcription elongation GreA/GreB family factor
MTLNKSAILAQFIEVFEREHAALTQSAKAAHEAATHEEAQAEDKHDTRATEASYLAQGQAVRVAEIERMIVEFKSYAEASPRQFTKVQLGSLVELESDGKTLNTFFAVTGGGTQISIDGKTVTITTPKSPLGEAIDGLSENDNAEVETKAGSKEYLVRMIR